MDLVRREEALHVTRRSLLRFVDFRRVIVGQFVSQVADAALLLVMAKYLLFADANGPSPVALGQAAVSGAIPLVLAGPIAGVVADRWPRKQVLVTGQAVRAVLAIAALVSVVFDVRSGAMAVFVLAACASRVLYTARVASIRHLVRHHELVAADSLMQIIGVVAGLVGAGFFAVAQTLGWSVVIGGVVVAHFAAAYAYDRTRSWLGGDGVQVRLAWFGALAQIGRGKARYALLATSSHRLFVGVLVAAISLHLDGHTGGAASGYAATIGVVGLAGFLGSVTAEWMNEHLRRRALTIAAFALSGVAVAPMQIFGGTGWGLVAVGVAAFSFQNLRVASDATIQANAAPGSCGRVFALYDIAFNLSYIVGILVGLAVASNTSVTIAIEVASPAFLFFAVVFAVIERESRDSEVSIDESHDASATNATSVVN